MSVLLQAVQIYENMTSTTTAQDIFFPVVDNSFIPAAPSTLLRTGQFHQNISIITGWNYDDGTIFTDPSISTSNETLDYISSQYPYLNTTTLNTLLDLYSPSYFIPAAITLNISAELLRSARIWRDVNFACPALLVAQSVAASGSASYVYQLNATAFAPLLARANASYLGIIHLSDVPYVFNNVSLFTSNSAHTQLAKLMSGSWANFATAGSPTGDTTLQDWPMAIPAANETQAVVRIIGGIGDGARTYSLYSPDELLRRCTFINSPEFYAQTQT